MRDRQKGIERTITLADDDTAIARALDDPEAILARILDPARRGNLYPFYHRLRELAPAHTTRVPGLPADTVVLTSYHLVDRVARSPAAVNDPRTAAIFDVDGTGRSAFYRLMRHAMLFLEKEAHDRVRRLVYKAFTPAAVAPLGALTESVANELIDATEPAGEMDFVAQFAYPLPLRAIMRLLGLPRESEDAIERWAWDFARAGDPMSATPEIVARGDAAAIGFHDFFSRLIEERLRKPRDDLVTALVQAEGDGGRLSREESISTLVLLLQAGHDTTSDLLGNALIALFRHPDERARLVARPESLPVAIEELLRFDTSVQMSMRLVREPLDLDDRTLPAGGLVALGYGAANRDPARFEDPDRLVLRRNPAHLSFSAGAYYCLGNALARVELQTALGVLFRRMPTIRPAEDRYVERWTTRLRGPLELRVEWD